LSIFGLDSQCSFSGNGWQKCQIGFAFCWPQGSLENRKEKTQEIKLQPASRVQPEEDKAVNIFRCQKGQDKEKPPN